MRETAAGKRRFAFIPAIACAFLLVLSLATTNAWHIDKQDTPLLELASSTLDAKMVFDPDNPDGSLPVMPDELNALLGRISIDVRPSARMLYEITLTTKSEDQWGVSIPSIVERVGLGTWSESQRLARGIFAENAGSPGDYDWDPAENVAKFYGCIPEGSSIAAVFANVLIDISNNAALLDTFTVTADFRACQATFEAVQDIFGAPVAAAAGAAGILLNDTPPVGIPTGTTYAWLSLSQTAQALGHVVVAGRSAPGRIEISTASSIRNESASESGISREAPGTENDGDTGNSGSGINGGNPPDGSGSGDAGGDPADGSGGGNNASGNENMGEADHE
jgi:hypothetical protein